MSAASKDIELTEKKTDDGRPQRSNSRSSEAMSKRSNKGGGFGTDRSLSKSRDYKPCCKYSCGLSCQDWFITLGLLLVLYAVVSGIFTGMMLWLQNTQKTILNGDYALWICFSFGMMYWIIVTIMVATGERVQFDSAIAEEDLEETKNETKSA